jgi:hypothetical protein
LKTFYFNKGTFFFLEGRCQMTSSNPIAGWEKVGDQFYRKVQLYDAVFDEDLELENYIVAGAPYGGALGKERERDQCYGAEADVVPQLYIEMRASFNDIELVSPRSQALISIHTRGSSSVESMYGSYIIEWRKCG